MLRGRTGKQITFSLQEIRMTATTINEVEAPSPLKTVSNAVLSASENLRSGLKRINISNSLSQLVYKSTYGLSYGVVYGVVFVANVFPKNNPVAHGLTDGARAALDAVADTKDSLAPTAA
jgi:hypothetical protein